eukprot:TRINITY_DN22382_c0_g1_i1.p1 TRINITY_DN22382_c0_g1~~TRINITY_DN22382_c0_g1_i1.p1  ORF type:complete len:213 (-),score=42.02 TRINITY_DN22382_c0_g1_i1:141-779(-)
MNPNLLNRALKKIKSNPEARGPNRSDTKASNASTDFIIKDCAGGREYRQQARAPYSRQGEKGLLEGRFVPKSGPMKGPWKHDLCPIQDKPKYRVFIRGLPADTSADTLRKAFERYGEIIGVRVDKSTASVYYASRVAAQRAGSEGSQVSIQGVKVKAVCCDEGSAARSLSESVREEKAEETLESDKLKGSKSILDRIKKSALTVLLLLLQLH